MILQLVVRTEEEKLVCRQNSPFTGITKFVQLIVNCFTIFPGKEYFVCDFKGHCVVVFNEEGKFLRRIGCENVTNFPNGIDISDAGDILIGDSHGNRFHVTVFSRDGSLTSEFECPYVKVREIVPDTGGERLNGLFAFRNVQLMMFRRSHGVAA